MLAVPDRIGALMAELEAIDGRDRDDGTPFERRLRAIKPDTGRLLIALVLALGARTVVEIGTSSGYSGLWFSLALRRTGGRLITYETDAGKVDFARDTFRRAGVEDVIELRAADGIEGLGTFHGSVDLVFLDAEKNLYERMLEPAVEALRPGGLLVADNLISHESALVGFRERALADPRLAGLVVPVGSGELVAARL